jgi:hypothetical protein
MKSDLILILNEIDGDVDLDIRDLMGLFEAFGDDYTYVGVNKVKITENEATKALRKEHNK